MIEVSNVTKKYGKRTVISEVHLPVNKHRLTAFIGPNGAGKSSLLAMINRMMPHVAGEIYLDHNELKACQSKELARKLAQLKQGNPVAMKISVRELVGLERYPDSKGKMTPADHDAVDVAMENLGLLEMANDSLDTLSGGQLQRACLALVLAQDREFILLDEPLTNLDAKQSAEVMKMLQRQVYAHGKTVIMVMQDINAVLSYADEVLAMNRGGFVAHGRTADVLQEKLLRELYDMDVRIFEADGQRFCMYFG